MKLKPKPKKKRFKLSQRQRAILKLLYNSQGWITTRELRQQIEHQAAGPSMVRSFNRSLTLLHKKGLIARMNESPFPDLYFGKVRPGFRYKWSLPDQVKAIGVKP